MSAVRYICALRDDVTGLFGAPFCDYSEFSVLRGIQLALESEDLEIPGSLDDFSFYVLGCYSDDDGLLFRSGSVSDGGVVNALTKEIAADLSDRSVTCPRFVCKLSRIVDYLKENTPTGYYKGDDDLPF